MPATSPRVSGAVSRLLQAGQISRVDEESGVLQTLHADCPHDGQRASVRRMSRELGGPVMEVTMRCSTCFRDFVAMPDALYLHPRTSRPARAAAAPAAKSSAKKAAPAAKKTVPNSAPKAAKKTAPKAAKKSAAKTAKKSAPKAAKQAARQATKSATKQTTKQAAKSAAKAAKKGPVKRAAAPRTPAASKSRRT